MYRYILKGMIGLMDCNNFFVSCERLFRPDLLRKPVAVLSSNDGCIVARSQEVKDLGIEMGVPYFEVKDLCSTHGVTLFSSNFTLYLDISSRVMRALRQEFSLCEGYSIDESFFEVEDGIAEDVFMHIRDRILRKTGILVSIGVASTKTLAKLASRLAKKGSGVCVLDRSRVDAIASEISCGNIWGIGRKTASFLSQNNIFSLQDLKGHDVSFIRNNLGIVGERLYMELTGIPVYKVGNAANEIQGSYMSTRSFGKSIKDKSAVESALAHHVAVLAEKLRRDAMMATQITVIAQGSRFGDFSHRRGSCTQFLSAPTHNTLLLTKEAMRMFQLFYDSEIPYKRAGIVLGCIVPEYAAQQTLFTNAPQGENDVSLDGVIDSINRKYGRGTVVNGLVINKEEEWRGRRDLKSPEYTTYWDEIPKVSAH